MCTLKGENSFRVDENPVLKFSTTLKCEVVNCDSPDWMVDTVIAISF